jgi:hypothetical protein
LAAASYQPGDVLIFHCLTPHAAFPDTGSALPISGDFRWQVPDHPAPSELNLGRAGHGWEVFSGLFHDRLWWEPVPVGLDLRPRVELAAKPPGRPLSYLRHPPRLASVATPVLNCPLARRHDHRSARCGPTDSRRRAAGHPRPRHLGRRSRRSRACIDDMAGWLCGRLGAAAQGRAARGQRRS